MTLKEKIEAKISTEYKIYLKDIDVNECGKDELELGIQVGKYKSKVIKKALSWVLLEIEKINSMEELK